MFKNEDFQGFFAPPADYQTEEILLFSYSLNLVILDELIRKSEIFSFKNNITFFVKLHVMITAKAHQMFMINSADLNVCIRLIFPQEQMIQRKRNT
ncbi:MAG: hypothetical protein Q4D76_19865, partial [Oscillospiraceae bacterium]|nr:hypothetical protein [Oscillospiraceae bacterium]